MSASRSDELVSLRAKVQRLQEENRALRKDRQEADLQTAGKEQQVANGHQLQYELRKAKEYAESIVETIHEPLLVLTPDCLVKSANQAFYDHFEVGPEDTLGQRIYDLDNGQWAIPELRTLLEDVLSDSNVFNDYEVAHKFEDIGERVMLVNARRLEHVQLILLGIRDITEKKRSEEAIRANEEQLRLITDGIPALISYIDTDLHYRFANKYYEHWFGRTADEIVGKHLREFLGEAAFERLRPHAEAALAGRRQSFEAEISFKEGGTRHVRSEFVPDVGLDGSVAGYYALVTDVTEQKRAEMIIRANEEQIRNVLEGMGEGFGLLAPDFTILEHNREALRLAGRPREKIVGYSHWDVYPGTEASELGRLLKKAMTERISVSLEYRYIFEEGRARWLDMRAYPTANGLLAVFWNDVTTRKEAEVALCESEKRYRQLFENMTEGFGIGEPILDAKGHPCDFRLLAVNKGFEKQSGLSSEIVGRPASEVLPELESFWIDTYGKVALAGDPIRFEEFNRDTGRYYDVYCYRPAENRFAILFRDVTESRKAQETLRKSEEKYRAIFEQAAVGIGRVRFEDARWIDVNDTFCDMLGYSPQEVMAVPWPEITHPEDVDLDLIPFRRMAAGELESYSVEKRYIHQQGHHVWARLTLSLVRNADGQPDYEIAVIENITERKQAEEALKKAKATAEEANRAKSEFLANMSHEIRTPMTVFLAAIEHLLQIDSNPQRRHLLGMADQSAKRLRVLIDDILDFSQIEARKVEIDETLFDLRQCLEEAVKMFTLPAKKKNLKLESDVSADTPGKVVGDPNRLSQVLINLIGNAIKFTQDGEIRVCVQPRGSFLEFGVADTGIGIPKEKQHLLFESFSQVDTSFHRQHGGSGLGLAISRGLVELMGGKISLRSRPGEGSVFTFTLPLKKPVKPAHEPSEAPSPEPDERFRDLRILLAEDEPMIQEMICMMLQRLGLKAETAETGRDALQKWEEGDFDLILMDLQMPEMNGMDTTRSIREKEKGVEKHTCIIGLTAHVRREVQEECLTAGMDRVLVKPVQMNDLFTAIEDCLSG